MVAGTDSPFKRILDKYFIAWNIDSITFQNYQETTTIHYETRKENISKTLPFSRKLEEKRNESPWIEKYKETESNTVWIENQRENSLKQDD